MLFKRVFAFALVAILLLSVCIPAFAHTTLQVYLFDGEGSTSVGGELMGWKINETCHTNGTSFLFRFDSTTNGGFTSTQKTNIRNGLYLWVSSPFTFSETNNSTGVIVYSPSLSASTPVTLFMQHDSSGHITAWTMYVNPTYATTVRIAREFGHIIGLNNLTSTLNKNKIMYSGTDGTATAPHTQDKWGAKVITGYHSSHTWTYEYSTLSKHLKKCTKCGGYKTEGCTYNSSGYCTKCGHQQSVSGDGFFEPIEAILPSVEGHKRTPNHCII